MSASDERRYQVFVSSTFRDLQEERQKVLQAVLEMKAFPAGMELFPSADDEQWEFIKREIESSDYYVVIVAGKYGSRATDGKSFTEKEYDYAVSLSKPVMGFLARNLDDLKGSNLEKDEAAQVALEAFRERVRSGKLVKFFSNPDELKAQVIQALLHSFQFRPQEGWVKAKNARRIEDLQEITDLQAKVMRMRETIARLERAQADATAAFAQGEDILEWVVSLHPTRANSVSPEAGVVIRIRWNDMLLMAFPDGKPKAYESSFVERLAQRITDEGRLMPDARSTAGDSARELLKVLRTQFLGLGYIEFGEERLPNGSYAVWTLTQKGRLQLLALRGVRRREDIGGGGGS